MTERGSGASATRPNVGDDVYQPTRRNVDETKASFKTTELWTAVVGVVLLIVVYNASSDLSFDLFRACLLATILAAGYIISRGIVKSGAHHHSDDTHPGR